MHIQEWVPNSRPRSPGKYKVQEDFSGKEGISLGVNILSHQERDSYECGLTIGIRIINIIAPKSVQVIIESSFKYDLVVDIIPLFQNGQRLDKEMVDELLPIVKQAISNAIYQFEMTKMSDPAITYYTLPMPVDEVIIYALHHSSVAQNPTEN